jgi:hypothetical protein
MADLMPDDVCSARSLHVSFDACVNCRMDGLLEEPGNA